MAVQVCEHSTLNGELYRVWICLNQHKVAERQERGRQRRGGGAAHGWANGEKETRVQDHQGAGCSPEEGQDNCRELGLALADGNAPAGGSGECWTEGGKRKWEWGVYSRASATP